MAEKPKDNKPATEFGEVKVIKNEPPRDPAGKTPGSAESGALEEPASPATGGARRAEHPVDKAQKDKPGKTPGSAEG